MSFSLELQSKCRRSERMAEHGADTFRSMLEPFRLEKCYPPVPKQRPDGSWYNSHEIQLHQKKVHARVSLSGQTAKAVLFSCVGGETVLAGRPIRDWVSSGERPTCLPTLFGSAVPEAPYWKGRADLYRVRTLSGREMVVTAQHRFLTPRGWCQLQHLRGGDAIGADGKDYDGAGLEISRDSTANCWKDSHPYGGSLSPQEVAILCKRLQLHGSNGEPSRLPLCDRLSTTSDLLRSLGQHSCEASLEQRISSELLPGWYCNERQSLETTPLLHRACGTPTCQCRTALQRKASYPYQHEYRTACADSRKSHLALLALPEQQPSECGVRSTSEELPDDLGLGVSRFNYTNVVVDTSSFWDEIVSIEWDRFDDYYDIGVPGPEHYSAQGLWNHNSGVGAGKTICMCAEMLKLMRTYPRIKIVVVTAYDYYFDEFLMPIWYQVLPEGSRHVKKYNRKSRTIVLTNGSTIRFKAYDDPEKIKGWEAHVVWVEEGSEIGDGNNDKAMAIWQALLMRLRAARPPYPPRIYVTQNPKGHNWIWRVFIKNEPSAPQPLGDRGIRTVFGHDKDGHEKFFCEWDKVGTNGDVFYTIACGTTANDHVPAGYVSSMLGSMADTPGLRQRMVEGMFNPINSLVYDLPIYSEHTHLIDYRAFLDYWEIDEIPPWWRVVVGIDCGGRSPWAIEYYVETEDGHWVCFDEIYQKGLVWNEVVDLIKKKSERFHKIEYWIDPISSQQKSGPTGTNIEQEFGARGIRVKMPRGYNKHGGVGRVTDFLKLNNQIPCPYKNDVQSDTEDGGTKWENGHAQLYYLKGVPWVPATAMNPERIACLGNIREKQVWRWDQTKQREAKATEEGLSPLVSEKFVDRDDHAQTAEIFAFLGIRPFVSNKDESGRLIRRGTREQPASMYGKSHKRRRM